MEQVASTIIKNKEAFIDGIIDDKEFQDAQKMLNCDTGNGFCKGTQRMFEIFITAQWRPLTLHEALSDALENVAKFFIQSTPEFVVTIIDDRAVMRIFLNKLSEEGTSLSVLELQKVIGKKIVYWLKFYLSFFLIIFLKIRSYLN